MGIFSRKTDEQKQAELQAKLDKAQAKIAEEQKWTDKDRANADKQTMKHKIALAKRGVDAGAATNILWTDHENGKDSLYLCTMPDAVVIYQVQIVGGLNKLKGTDTIPYSNINSVQHDKKGLLKEQLTLVTSGQTYVFETMDYAKFVADTINERR